LSKKTLYKAAFDKLDAVGHNVFRNSIEMFWQILAEPQVLDGTAQVPFLTLLRAVNARSLHEQLRREIAVEELESLFGEEADTQLLNALEYVIEARRASVAGLRSAFLRLRVSQRLIERYHEETCQALRLCAHAFTKSRCSACLQFMWNSTVDRKPLELCILSCFSRPESTTSIVPSRGKRTQTGDGNRGVQLFDTSKCPSHRVAAVGATMGLGQKRLDQNVKHSTVRDLRHAILAFQQLPLDTVIKYEDPYGICPAMQNLLGIIVQRLTVYCWQSDPPLTAEVPLQKNGECIGDDACLRPADFVRTDAGHVRDYACHFLFYHLHKGLFPSEPTQADMALSRSIKRLAWLQPRHLELPEKLVQTSQSRNAVSSLQDIHALWSPGEMLARLASIFHTVTEAAGVRAQLNSTSGGDVALGADESLPIFILLVVLSNPWMFHSVLSYVECSITRSQMLTVQGYALTQAKAVVSFLESAQPSNFVGLRPDEYNAFVTS